MGRPVRKAAPAGASSGSDPSLSNRKGAGGAPGGKIAALRALVHRTDFPPERIDHPVLHRAYSESIHYRGLWRERFRAPKTDPRYLDATDEQILSDLLVGMYQDGRARRAADPALAALEEAAAKPQVAAKAMERVRQAFATGGKLMAQILKFEAKRRRGDTPQKVIVRALPKKPE